MSARRSHVTLGLVVALGACAEAPAPAPAARPMERPTPVTPPATPPVRPTPVTEIPGHEDLPQDGTPKESPRLMPAETLMRSYLTLFGGLSPLDLQRRLRGMEAGSTNSLFESWTDYLTALGIPDYARDIGRADQSNALMLAAFERIGVALCDRAVENDLRGAPMARRVIFQFDMPAGRALTDAEFATRFDELHQTFLGYPAAQAPAERGQRFLRLFRDAATRRAGMTPAAMTRFNGVEAGWALVCYGLVRHPEFHLY